MQEEQRDSQAHASSKSYNDFRKLTTCLRELVKKRQEMQKAGATQEQLLANKRDSLYYQVLIREAFRELHQVIFSNKKTEAKSHRITKEKDSLDAISNYYEGLLYQKNNIEREILNCKNVILQDLEKLDEMREDIEFLGKRVDDAEIEELDRVDLVY